MNILQILALIGFSFSAFGQKNDSSTKNNVKQAPANITQKNVFKTSEIKADEWAESVLRDIILKDPRFSVEFKMIEKLLLDNAAQSDEAFNSFKTAFIYQEHKGPLDKFPHPHGSTNKNHFVRITLPFRSIRAPDEFASVGSSGVKMLKIELACNTDKGSFAVEDIANCHITLLNLSYLGD